MRKRTVLGADEECLESSTRYDLKDTFGNQTAFKYGLDGKIRDIRHLGDGNWNAGEGGAESAGSMNQDAAVSQPAGSGQRILQQYECNARGQVTGID